MSLSTLLGSVAVPAAALLALLLVALYANPRRSRSSGLPTDWPVVGVLPSLAANHRHIHDHLTALLDASGRGFHARIVGMRLFFTCDPANVQHMFTANRANYAKGAEFAEIFDIIGGTLFTIDGEPARRQRAKFQGVLSSPRLFARMATLCRDKVENGLLPLLNGMASTGSAFDVQELMTRFIFDLTATPVFGVDPGLLSPDMPPVHVPDAMDTVMEMAFRRHSVPATCWKLLRWLKIRPERKLAEAHRVLHGFITEMMARRRRRLDAAVDKGQDGDILSSYVDDPDYQDDHLLRGTLIGYMIAGRDTVGSTLSWIFYSLAKNPQVVSTIRDELSPTASRKASIAGNNNGADTSTMTIFEPEETKPLVYLQAALYECLRLYPSAPTERKKVLADDVMPTGHEVRAGDTVIVSLYAMGRMASVWGEDCREYRPGRWLSEDGSELRYVPSHKFLTFSSGPRMCLGKDVAIMQLKTVVAAVAWNFDMELLAGQSMEPRLSCILQTKNGIMMKMKKREI